jgi:signal transduction histidine kinase
VRVSVEVRPDEVWLSVADTGIGISEEDRETIFEMFRQVDGSDSRRYGGVGLGLYIVRRFAQQIGASIEVESEIGKGTVFRLRLPLPEQEAAPTVDRGLDPGRVARCAPSFDNGRVSSRER